MKYVYLIQIEGMDIYKIGFTKSNPIKRLESLQTGNPFKLLLVDSYKTKRATKIESVLHQKYISYKVNEDESKILGEWFKLSKEIIEKFKSICEQIDTNFQIIEEMSTLNN